MKRKIFSKLLMGAFLIASVSMFVSCKDYDDDIQKNAKDIAALQTQLSTLNNALTTAQSAATAAQSAANDAATAAKAAQGTADAATTAAAAAKALAEAAASAQTVKDLQDAVSTLETAIKGNIDQDALDTAIKAVEAKITAIDEKLLTLDDVKTLLADEGFASDAVVQNLSSQITALNTFKTGIEALGLADWKTKADAAISSLTTIQNDVKTNKDDITTLKTNVQKAQTALEGLEGVGDKINLLTVLVNKILTSVTLVPNLYIKGIEAIEFKSLKYTPMKFVGTAGTPFGDDIQTNLEKLSASVADVIRDNAETEADYRVSPKAVSIDDIDVDNIAFFGKTAKTRAAETTKNSPVKYVAGSAKLADTGILTVKLAKTGTSALKSADDAAEIDIVSLMVPRKAIAEKNQEYAEIYSEFARVVEKTITPRIAALPWDADHAHDKTNPLNYHYSDSATIWAAEVNNADLNAGLVKKEVKFDTEFDLLTLVTGCVIPTPATAAHTEQITKEELAKYGLEFKFAIPETVYKTAAPHETNQQKFGKLKADGHTLISTIENGTEKNPAAAGKEPIIRVTLVDTNNGNIVDLRYLKIKWVEDDAPNKDAVDLGTVTTNVAFACKPEAAEITWEQFINDVYGKALEGKEAMSQETFESIYDSFSYTTDPTTVTAPNITTTTNKKGDALVANWDLSADDWGTIPADGKTITATITFKSSQPKAYGDLILKWEAKMAQPTSTAYVGTNPYIWKDENILWVQPVQYNTTGADAKVKYDFNLMAAFTRLTEATSTQWIVRDMAAGTCNGWDIQFRKTQSLEGYATKYVNGGGTAEPQADATGKESYILQNATPADVLTLDWTAKNADGKYWVNAAGVQQAHITADNTTVEPILNYFTDENEADGITPIAKSDKLINIAIFGKFNEYNYFANPIKDFKLAFVAPIRVNAVLQGYFVDLVAGGSKVNFTDALTITDFAGYAVKEGGFNAAEIAAAPKVAGIESSKQWGNELYKYYGITAVTPQTDKVKYGLKVNSAGNIEVDSEINVDNADTKGMTADEIKAVTTGGMEPSITFTTPDLIFKNLGGQKVTSDYDVFIPVEVKYELGTVTRYVKVTVHPAGYVAP